MKRHKELQGFSLIEVLIVLAIMGSMLAMLSSHYQHQQQRNRVEQMVADLTGLKNAVYSAVLSGIENPDIEGLIAAELYHGALVSPWQEPYIVDIEGPQVRIRGYAGTSQWANAIARRLPLSREQGNWIELTAAKNSSSLDPQWLLHRLAVPEAPELNQMAADLDMQGWRILGASEVYTQQLISMQLTAEEIFTDWLQVDDQIQAEVGVFDWLSSESLQANSAAIAHLQVQTLDSEQVVANTMQSSMLATTTLFVSGTLVADQVQAQYISAADFITPTTSLSALQQEFQQLQQLWLQCLHLGSCE